MVKKEIEGLLELNSSKCQEEEIMKVNLKVLVSYFENMFFSFGYLYLICFDLI